VIGPALSGARRRYGEGMGMQRGAKAGFPEGSLLAAMLGEHAPTDVRRAAQRLRAEGAPAVAVADDMAELARGLALSDVARSPAVLEALPPLFWVEGRREDGPGAIGIGGWVVEKRGAGLAARGFGLGRGPGAVPEPRGTATVSFAAGAGEEDGEARVVRGLVAAIGLPEMLAEMGEASPILLMPAEAPDGEASLLRSFRLSVAIAPDAAPG